MFVYLLKLNITIKHKIQFTLMTKMLFLTQIHPKFYTKINSDF